MSGKLPPIIEGTYRVVDGHRKREPIFNNWRYAVPLVALVVIRLIWVLTTGH